MAHDGDAGPAARTGYATGRSTREAMIVTAERLFADRGFDAVSLREIAAAAGTRNSGAGQYYFGDKERLVQAIFEYRAPVLNARRAAMLTQAGQGQDGVRDTMAAIIRPLAEQIGAGHYVSFLARLQADHLRDQSVRTGETGEARGEVEASFRQAQAELRRQLPDLPAEVFRRRFRFSVRMSIAALAEHQRATLADHQRADHADGAGHADSTAAGSLDDLVTDLIDATAGMLLAPSSRSPETHRDPDSWPAPRPAG